jgi:hypothetical protein
MNMENPLIVQMALATNFRDVGRGSTPPDELPSERGDRRVYAAWALVEAMGRPTTSHWWVGDIHSAVESVVADPLNFYGTDSDELEELNFWQSATAFSEELPIVDDDTEIRNRFNDLTRLWREETVFLSSPADIILNFNYQQIIGMGPTVVPLIIEELQNRGGFWYWALRAITGADPVPPKYRGNSIKMKETWLNWYRQNR